MKVGDKVKKTKGYQFTGIVVSVFENSKGQVRVVVEHIGSQTESSGGMLHIFNTKQLQVICYQVVDGDGNPTNGLTYRNYTEALKCALQEYDRCIKEVIIEIGLDGNPK